MRRLILIFVLAFAAPVAAEDTAFAHQTTRPLLPRLKEWREHDPEIGRTRDIIAMLRKAAADDAGSEEVRRTRGHRLFRHMVYRAYSPEDDASPEALDEAFVVLNFLERSRLRARADEIVTSLFFGDHPAKRRFERARGHLLLTETLMRARLIAAAVAEHHHNENWAHRLRVGHANLKTSTNLVYLERLLRGSVRCGPRLDRLTP